MTTDPQQPPRRPAEQPCRLAAMGIVNALGRGGDAVWNRLIAGDASGIALREDAHLYAGKPMYVGAVRAELSQIPEHLSHYDCRNNAFTLTALDEIAGPIEAAVREYGAARIGVVMGTSTSGTAECETAMRHAARAGELGSAFRYEQIELGGAAGFVAEVLQLGGPTFTLSTACSSSARAFASARSLLRLGLCDAVLAGGSDSLCGLTMEGFASLQAISGERCNPMSANRSGLTLGEGAAIFLVTRESGGIQLSGVGESSEAHHMSAPDPEGRGAIASMRGALADAQLPAEAIAYLNLHGTATQLNDAMESRAAFEIFGDRTPCSSTKPLVGHTLGAAGATELAFCWLALARRDGETLALPPHLYDGERDPELPAIALTGLKSEATRVGRGAHLMTNSFGFGGNNCTLIVSESDA